MATRYRSYAGLELIAPGSQPGRGSTANESSDGSYSVYTCVRPAPGKRRSQHGEPAEG